MDIFEFALEKEQLAHETYKVSVHVTSIKFQEFSFC